MSLSSSSAAWYPHDAKSGATLDSDGVLDGHITDPGLPALLGAPAPGNAQAIPTLGEWGALLLAALLGLVGLRRVHARSPA